MFSQLCISPSACSTVQFLYSCARKGDVPGMLCALAHGANVNFVNDKDNNSNPLIQTIYSGSLAASEFLLQNGVRLHVRDGSGRGVLHHCALTGETRYSSIAISSAC